MCIHDRSKKRAFLVDIEFCLDRTWSSEAKAPTTSLELILDDAFTRTAVSGSLPL